jgi:hypothetical protein
MRRNSKAQTPRRLWLVRASAWHRRAVDGSYLQRYIRSAFRFNFPFLPRVHQRARLLFLALAVVEAMESMPSRITN